jgi:hypothetical protein
MPESEKYVVFMHLLYGFRSIPIQTREYYFCRHWQKSLEFIYKCKKSKIAKKLWKKFVRQSIRI